MPFPARRVECRCRPITSAACGSGSAALARQRIERRLAAILAADVAGYSRLMGADEEGTLAQLNTHRRELIDPVRGAIPSSGNTRSDGGKPPQGRIAGSVTAIRALAAAALLLLSPAVGAPQAREQAKRHRIAIVISSGAVSSISDKGTRAWQAFFEELRRLGDVEGQNLTVDRYSGEGRPEGYADLAREVVSRNPVVIVAANDATAQAARAETDTIPIVWIGGDPIQAGLAASLAHPGGNITGVTVSAGVEIWGKRLQILKEASPTASKTAYLTTRISQGVEGQQLREAGERSKT